MPRVVPHPPSSSISSLAVQSGSLTTPDGSHPDLTIVAVSHDRPGELPSGGEINLWGALGERLRSPWQGVEAILHLGGQVWRLVQTQNVWTRVFRASGLDFKPPERVAPENTPTARYFRYFLAHWHRLFRLSLPQIISSLALSHVRMRITACI